MNEEQFFDEKPQANILQQIVQRYLPFWPVFLLFTCISMAVAWVYLRAQTRIYVAAAKVMIRDPKKSSTELQVLEGITQMPDVKSIENEIIILRSGDLMQQVVKDLDIYTVIFNEGKVQTEELYGDNAPVVFQAIHEDSINPGGKIPFDINWDQNYIEIAGQKVQLGSEILTIAGTHYKVIPNKNYNTEARGKNFSANFYSVAQAAGILGGGLRANQPNFTSSVIDLSIQTPVPERAKAILNRLCEVYNIQDLKDKNQQGVQTLAFIEERLDNVERQLDSVNQNITAYKSRESVTDLSGQATTYFGIVKELDKRNTELDLQLEVLNDIQQSAIRNHKSKISNQQSLHALPRFMAHETE